MPQSFQHLAHYFANFQVIVDNQNLILGFLYSRILLWRTLLSEILFSQILFHGPVLLYVPGRLCLLLLAHIARLSRQGNQETLFTYQIPLKG